MERLGVVLSSCDDCKSSTSMVMLGVFDDENILKDVICRMFERSQIRWRGYSIHDLKTEIESEYYQFSQSMSDDLYDEDGPFDIEKEIKSDFEDKKEKVLSEIRNSCLNEIDRDAERITLAIFTMNEL